MTAEDLIRELKQHPPGKDVMVQVVTEFGRSYLLQIDRVVRREGRLEPVLILDKTTHRYHNWPEKK